MRQCQEIAGGRSVDVIEIDAASNTEVEETKSVLEGVRYAPARARRKVYIIDEVHMLSAHSFNALLKTLEEPPPHVVFIFATTEVHKIPATILSRCQRFDFKLISTARLTEHLTESSAEKIAADDEAVRVIARQAAGSVRDGLSLLDQVIAYVGDAKLTRDVVADVLGVADRRAARRAGRAVLARDAGAALRRVARAADGGVDLGQLARAFLGFLRDLEIVGRVKDAGATSSTRRRTSSTRCGAGAARGAPGVFARAVRPLGARRRRGVEVADAAAAGRDGGDRSVRRRAAGADRRPARAPRRARGAVCAAARPPPATDAAAAAPRPRRRRGADGEAAPPPGPRLARAGRGAPAPPRRPRRDAARPPRPLRPRWPRPAPRAPDRAGRGRASSGRGLAARARGDFESKRRRSARGSPTPTWSRSPRGR